LKFDAIPWPATDGESTLKVMLLDRDPGYEDIPYSEAVDFFEGLNIRTNQLEENL